MNLRTSPFGMKVVLFTAWPAAIFLMLVAFRYIALFMFGLAKSPGEALAMILLALVYTLIAAGLPTLAAILQPTHPKDAAIAWRLWLIGVIAIGVGVIAYAVAGQGGTDPGASRPVRIASQDRPITLIAERWLPGAQGDDAAHRFAILLASLAAMAGSGYLFRWIAISTSEFDPSMSIAPMPQQQIPVSQPQSPAGDDLFNFWIENRLRIGDPGIDKIQANDVYQDYAATCDINAQAPMSESAFGKIFGSISATKFGPNCKQKSNGRYFYCGWQWANQEMGQ